jgi:DNA-binding IclR family transcriptional regulator
MPGARCVGVALRDPVGRTFGALSVSGPASRMTDQLLEVIGHRLCEVAEEVRWTHKEDR